MSALKKISIKDQVYELIKNRILDQTYQLGERINMLELGTELEISISPVREALSLLEKEGLVSLTPHGGPRVVDMDQKLFDEVRDTAEILLAGSYEQCAAKGLIRDLVLSMEDSIEVQKQLGQRHAPESDYEFAKAALAFDLSFIKILGNTTMQKLSASFFDLLFLAALYDHQNCSVDRNEHIYENERILQAVKEGNHEDVKKFIHLHFGGKSAACR